MESPLDRCASEILEVIPLIMRSIRTEMRAHRSPELSVPQFRTLALLGRNEATSLSEVAEHLGLTLPSASKLVDDLVAGKMAKRKIDVGDRRRVALALTPVGRQKMRATHALARGCLAKMLTPLTTSDRTKLEQAMRLLQPLFAGSGAKTR